jgi:RecA-family ATPase
VSAQLDRITRLAGERIAPTPYTWAAGFPPLKSPEMIVEQLLEAGTLVCVFGDSNTGKSTFVLDIALRVAQGRAWRGRRTRKGIVLWLSLESAAGTRRRVAAHCARYEWRASGLLFADVTAAVGLLELHEVRALVAAIRQAEAEAGEKCVLIVVDTLARAMAGGDENTSQDMGQLVKACDIVRSETGATVLLIHHSGKDPSRGARGSGALRAAIDTEIEVSGQANPRTARVTKQRDLPTGDAFAFDLEPIELGADIGQAFTACAVVHRDDVTPAAIAVRGKAQASILRALRAQQDEQKAAPIVWTLEDLRRVGRNLGQSKSTARSAVDGIVTSGLLVPTVGGHRLADGAK